MAPRVRFCPSPTGPFHVGGARTALFNWLFARNQGGAFLLRNEDTDPVRSEAIWLEGILEGLRWLGLDWDEEIVHQSERREEHVAAGHALIASGHAYWCDCTAEAIEARKGPGGGYDGFCRDRGLDEGPDRVVRFRTPDSGTTTVNDVVRPDTVFDNELIDDFVIVRRGGAPMFVLANAVDDEFQRVTHVIRGDEHLPTTPRYVMLRHAFGWPQDPVFAHLPVLVNEQRKKLSKRRDKVALLQYRDEGYLAEAMSNYLALLGWSPGDEEITTREHMVERFRLEDVSRAPAFFDVVKLQHFNAHYLREMPAPMFTAAARPWVESAAAEWDAATLDWEAFGALAPLAQTRVKTLAELPEMVAFVFEEPVQIDPAAWQKSIEANAWSGDVLRATEAAYADCAWDADTLKDVLVQIGEGVGIKLGKAQAPVRVATTGRVVGLPLFESLEVLGRPRSLQRLQQAIAKLT